MSGIILVDGISGAGKGSSVPFIASYVSGLGYTPLCVREPSSFLESQIRDYRKRSDRSGHVEALLFAADRRYQYEHLIAPFLDNNPKGIVISDRSFLSSFVYQSQQGVPLEELRSLNAFYPKPLVALLLLCEAEKAIVRIEGRALDRGADEQVEKIRRLKKGYEDLALGLQQRIVRTDGSLLAVEFQIASHLNTLFEKPMEKAILLDKDGTLVDNSGYPTKIPSDEIYFEHTLEGLTQLQREGYKIIIHSSQPWIAQGRMTLPEADTIFQSIVAQYASHGVTIDGFFYCPHAREEGCSCKKPKTGLLEQAAKAFHIDTTKSWCIGDMGVDIEMGRDFGLRTIRVLTGHAQDEDHYSVSPDYICPDVNAAAEAILQVI